MVDIEAGGYKYVCQDVTSSLTNGNGQFGSSDKAYYDQDNNADNDDGCITIPSSSQSSSMTSLDYGIHNVVATTSGHLQLRYRPIEPEDRDRIQALHEEWFPVSYHDEFYDELVLHRMPQTGQPLHTCVATTANDDRQIIACVVGAIVESSRLSEETRDLLLDATHTRLFYIMTLGTVTEFRKNGIAMSLIQKCMELVEDDPACGALYLHVLTMNQSAIRFYERLGFWRVQEIPDYYTIKGKHYNCYLYAKYINGNRGHLELVKIMTRWLSALWTRFKDPISFLLGSRAY